MQIALASQQVLERKLKRYLVLFVLYFTHCVSINQIISAKNCSEWKTKKPFVFTDIFFELKGDKNLKKTINLIPVGTYLGKKEELVLIEKGIYFVHALGGYLNETAISKNDDCKETKILGFEYEYGGSKFSSRNLRETLLLGNNEVQYRVSIGGIDTSWYLEMNGSYTIEKNLLVLNLKEGQTGGFYISEPIKAQNAEPREIKFQYVPELNSFMKPAAYERFKNNPHRINKDECTIEYKKPVKVKARSLPNLETKLSEIPDLEIEIQKEGFLCIREKLNQFQTQWTCKNLERQFIGFDFFRDNKQEPEIESEKNIQINLISGKSFGLKGINLGLYKNTSSQISTECRDNTDIKGLQVAFGINEQVENQWNQKIHLTGLQAAGLWNESHAINGIQMAGVYNRNKDSVNLQLAGFVNSANAVNGIQASLIVNHTEFTNGLQMGIVNNSERLYGIQLGLLGNLAYENFPRNNKGYENFGVQVALINSGGTRSQEKNLNGLQIGFHNMTAGYAVQLGVTNFVEYLIGIQIGLVNGYFKCDSSARKPCFIKGVQIGAYNQAAKSEGLQIAFMNNSNSSSDIQFGLINVSQKGTLQIGLINYSKDSMIPFFPFLRFSF